jgi:hypothetical protein
MAEQPRAVAWFVDEPVGPADPLRRVKERARAISDAAELLGGIEARGEASARADAIGQAAALFGDPAFSLAESYAAAEAAMPPDMVNSATNVALLLGEIEASAG